ncbi:hypothetical protein S245_039581, partial [Arachis hypogaea]
DWRGKLNFGIQVGLESLEFFRFHHHHLIVMVLEMNTIHAQLQRQAWIAGTLSILIASIPISRLNFLQTILLDFARRGKIMHSFFQGIIGILYHYKLLDRRLSSENWFNYNASEPCCWQAILLLLLMEVQVLRRLFETISVFKYIPSARMHILGYLTGMFFYLVAPMSLCTDCALDVFYFLEILFTKFIIVGKDHMPPVEVELWQVVNPLVRLGWRHWIGAAVLFLGWIHQQRCHKILVSVGTTDSALGDDGVLEIDTPIYLETTWRATEDLVLMGLVRSIGI